MKGEGEGGVKADYQECLAETFPQIYFTLESKLGNA